MTDERFEAWLRDAAKGYNRPPDIPPREEMWDHIEARGQSSEVRGNPLVADASAPLGARRSALGARTWILAAAAVLLLATGISLGYWARGGTAVAPSVAAVDSSAPGDSTRRVAVQVPVAQTPQSSTSRPPSPLAPRPSPLDGDLVEVSPETPTGYDVLTTETLTAAEALLVSFRTSEDTALDDLMRRWSRELLSTTRLLMESPAAGNAQRRRLLEDLELVLVQLAQLPSTDAALERELVKRAIARRQVLTRIRTSIPAGRASGT